MRNKGDTDRAISQSADRTAGVVSGGALRAIGIPARTIRRRVAAGAIFEALPDTYLVGHRAFTTERAWWLAVLSVGGPAWLTARSGCEAHGTLRPHIARITVAGGPSTEPRVMRVAWPGAPRIDVQVSRMRNPPAARARTAHGLPTLPIAHLLVGVAADGSDRQVRAALRAAEFERLTDDERARRALRRGRKGSSRLREHLDRRMLGVTFSRSRLEESALELFGAWGLPDPLTNVAVPPDDPVMSADFYFPDLNLVVEVDGPHHDTPESRVRDRAYDTALRARGLDLMRFGQEQLMGDRAQRELIRASFVGAGYLPPPVAARDQEPIADDRRAFEAASAGGRRLAQGV